MADGICHSVCWMEACRLACIHTNIHHVLCVQWLCVGNYRAVRLLIWTKFCHFYWLHSLMRCSAIHNSTQSLTTDVSDMIWHSPFHHYNHYCRGSSLIIIHWNSTTSVLTKWCPIHGMMLEHLRVVTLDSSFLLFLISGIISKWLYYMHSTRDNSQNVIITITPLYMHTTLQYKCC